MKPTLPSWNNGPVRSAIEDFVSGVVAPGGPQFVAPSERIAVFDNDGTLWAEYPMFAQVCFSHEKLRELIVATPALAGKRAYKAMLAGDMAALKAMPKQEVFEPALAVHAGMTVPQFQADVAEWLGRSQHPRYQRGFDTCYYQPQVELLEYLRAHGFKTFIATGGGIEFVRAVSQRLYGIPPEQVIGSSTRAKFDFAGGHAEIVKLAELGSFDDRDEKPVNIELHIGRRPILAFGNSDGDLAMLRYVLGGKGPNLALLLRHDDDAREAAYDRDFHVSPLDQALDAAGKEGIHVVSMQRDWTRIFP
ncbi:hypothetical protein ABB27_09230 [Stenotrophomonas terrae]|uniref:Phosphoserine phosphatase n=1 Tax=Stenotrophomonas terrae TaxID=405446 RepID=A0A0R0CEC0_9GAMM|nr:HAD family hydrolase [Stenotrophomonas terrae]KRG67733.1 hypothetical protein ABB27_09230 [Stenotrophomonas terrae]